MGAYCRRPNGGLGVELGTQTHGLDQKHQPETLRSSGPRSHHGATPTRGPVSVLNATRRLGHHSATVGSHGGFSAGEWHCRAGPRTEDRRCPFPGALLRPLPTAQAGFRAEVWGLGPAGRGAEPGRPGMLRGATPAGEPSPGAAPGPGRPPIGRLGVTPLYRETRLAAAAACAPALALYAEPPAGPLTMGGASARALGPS